MTGDRVEALPLIAPRHGVVDASEAGVPPTRPPSGKRPRSRADSTNVERPSISPPHDDPDYRDEVRLRGPHFAHTEYLTLPSANCR